VKRMDEWMNEIAWMNVSHSAIHSFSQIICFLCFPVYQGSVKVVLFL